jgi:hypothetical protein
LQTLKMAQVLLPGEILGGGRDDQQKGRERDR